METVAEVKKNFPAWAVLCIVALGAGLLIGGTNMLTEERILQQNLQAKQDAQSTVLPEAEEFETMNADGALDYCVRGLSGGATVGYVAQTTVNGYGGKIEVTAGVDPEGKLTGVSVGGVNFSETAGLGANTREPAFTNQFQGMSGMLALAKDGGAVDSVTGASISSGAVVQGVNAILEATARLGAQ